ncbi:DUF397 domain-containing protein [Saccharopolyspora flava]|uniref:DUF397 domain-containing protein n=1 Tax=Saccharopolyspora flava TaxID=95161 RepID=A0A1I6TNR8_9PSEU|nr:DUF397 domain-containing protein [Saccharopolyspora flava]SFS90815.1 protein of unknown function [Saccharopolyspora flava]
MISNNSNMERGGAPVGVWFKSSLSHPNGNDCVEVFFEVGRAHIRDSKDGGVGPSVVVPAELWQSFLDEVVGDGGANSAIRVDVESSGGATIRSRDDDQVALSYTPGEWTAFVAGVRNGEFTLPDAARLAA